MNKHFGSLHVLKKFVTETLSFRCAFDKSWNIGDDERGLFFFDVLADINHSEIWTEGCEVVGCDFWLGVADDADSVDFPADGSPIMPTSAIIFSSMVISRTSPSSPISAIFGA